MHTLNEGKLSDRGRGMHKSANVLLLYYRVRKGLRTFGVMGVVQSIFNIKFKVEDQVMTCVFLGFAQNHTGGTY